MSRSSGVAGGGGSSVTTTLAALPATVGPISAQTALQDITGLALPIGASATEVWLLELFLSVSAANITMDVLLGWSVPAGCSLRWGIAGGMTSELSAWGGRAASQTPLAMVNAAATIAVGTAAGISGVAVAAMVTGGGTAGNVQPRFAQATSDPGNLSIITPSLLRATKYHS